MDIKEGMIEVHRTSMKKEVRKTKTITVPFKTQPMYISLKVGKTIPQPYGFYGKAEIMISMPCYPEEMKEVYEEIRTTALQLLENEVERINKDSEDIERR